MQLYNFCNKLKSQVYLLSFFHQTFKLYEKLAEQDRERAVKRVEEPKAAPPAIQELEVQSEHEAEAPVEEKRSTEESTPVTAPSALSEETPAGATAASLADSDTIKAYV